jgi:hypothetical protein
MSQQFNNHAVGILRTIIEAIRNDLIRSDYLPEPGSGQYLENVLAIPLRYGNQEAAGYHDTEEF